MYSVHLYNSTTTYHTRYTQIEENNINICTVYSCDFATANWTVY